MAKGLATDTPSAQVEFPDALDLELPPNDSGLRGAWKVFSALAVAACCALVFVQLNPEFSLLSPNRGLLFANTTASGGDMGAHVWFPAFLRDHLLPHWRVEGWSKDWFGGFPAGQFYFPLPALLVVVLDLVLPYNVAFKVVSALGSIALPATVFAFGIGLRVRRPGPELMAIAATAFLFFRGIGADAGSHEATIQFNQRIMGGTLVSALAGEYSFSIALALSFGFLGALAFSLRTGRRSWLAALLLAAVVLSHVVVGIFVVVAAIVIWLFMRPLRTFWIAVAIGAVGAALTAFWTFPLLGSFGYTASMRYERLTWYVDYLLPIQLWWVFALGLCSAVIGAVRRDKAILAIAVITLVFAGVFRWWPELHAWNLRFLPFWYLGMFLLAGIAIAEAVRAVSNAFARAWVVRSIANSDLVNSELQDERKRFRIVRTAAAISLATIVVVGSLGMVRSSREFLDFWAEWNYSGYEDMSVEHGKPKAYPEHLALIETMRDLPPGLAMWEGGAALDAYGTPLALMLLPYWTEGRIGSLEGLYYESAASTPYVFMAVAALSGTGNSSNPVRGLDYRGIGDFDLGVRYLQILGARYYMAHSDEAKVKADAHPDLRVVAKVPDNDGTAPTGWNIYEVTGQSIVGALEYEPVVVDAKAGTQSACFGRPPAVGVNDPELGPWECLAADWWDSPEQLDRPLASGGPPEWIRASSRDAANVEKVPLPPVEVTNVRETDNSVAFRVSSVGVPVVVKSSYYPAWKAHGAKGPWRLTPNLMVVVPTERNVTLNFERTRLEWLGIAVSLIGIVGLVLLIRWRPGSRRRRARAR